MARSTLVHTTTILSLFTTLVLAGNVNYVFNIQNRNIAPDGVTRNAILVNNRFPGPLITANKGDTLKITVNNQLTNSTMRRSTTIHWHGLFQRGNAEEDGPAFVTQCPIAPQASYTYTIPLNGQSGTYWYHSHLASQYVDGLRGPIVVYDPQDPYRNQYDVDDETTVFTLADWYHKSAKAIEDSHNLTQTIPDSAVINGKGRYDPLNIPANPDTLYTLKVQRGKRYRLRVINPSAIASFRFSVQGHRLKVIEIDGGMTQPVVVDSLDVLVGQRYSVILCADQPPDTYWINAPVTNVLNTTAQALLVYEDVKPWHPPKGPYWTWTISQAVANYWNHKHGHHHRAHKARILGSSRGASGLGDELGVRARNAVALRSGHVKGAQLEKRADATNSSGVVLDQSKAIPLDSPGACGTEDPSSYYRVPIDFGLNFDTGLWMINGSTYHPPNVPTLLKILTNQADYATTENTRELPRNRCIQMEIGGNSLGITHPFHLHGHIFSVVDDGSGVMNLKNPPRRDVQGVNVGVVKIRFMTDNPGPWFLHCHIDWHLVEGLAMVFVEAPDQIPAVVHPDPAWKDLCKKYDALPSELQ